MFILYAQYFIYAILVQEQFPEHIIFPEELNKFLQDRIRVSIILVYIKKRTIKNTNYIMYWYKILHICSTLYYNIYITKNYIIIKK